MRDYIFIVPISNEEVKRKLAILEKENKIISDEKFKELIEKIKPREVNNVKINKINVE